MYTDLQLGSVVLLKKLTDCARTQLCKNLHESGLELQVDKKEILVEDIKHVIQRWTGSAFELGREKYSIYLSKTLKYKYNYLSNVFTKLEGISIQAYLIKNKVELVKELLSRGELSLVEIADRLGYSSSAHLSNQFKKVAGVSPRCFKNSV